jgi:hypothetical protein
MQDTGTTPDRDRLHDEQPLDPLSKTLSRKHPGEGARGSPCRAATYRCTGVMQPVLCIDPVSLR